MMNLTWWKLFIYQLPFVYLQAWSLIGVFESLCGCEWPGYITYFIQILVCIVGLWCILMRLYIAWTMAYMITCVFDCGVYWLPLCIWLWCIWLPACIVWLGCICMSVCIVYGVCVYECTIGIVFLIQFLWHEMNMLDNCQLAVLPHSGGTEFDPGSVHDNSLVPLWIICFSLCQSIKTNRQICVHCALGWIHVQVCIE